MLKDFDAALTDRVADAYEAYYDLLRFIARRRFRIPAQDIQALIHDVFVSFMKHERVIGDDRRWLIAAVSNASRNYWRNLRPGQELDQELLDPRTPVDDVLARHDVALLFAKLPVACRSILRLRYVEGLNAREIAARYGTSPGYVRLKVHRCLAAARRALGERS
jgi:RNA polymerase sigma factor (sigma-70 family)